MAIFTTILLALASQCVNAINLTVSSSGGNASSPLLYGMIFEDINHSGDGVLHGQLLRNNGFQSKNPGLTAWSSVGQADVSQDTLSPVSGAILSSLAIRLSANASGVVGASNAGYNGIRVTEDTYSSSFWVKGSYDGMVTVSLAGADGTVYGSSDVSVFSNSSAFTYYETLLSASTASGGNNSWHFTFDAATASDGGLNLGLPQLFPTTFHDRPNGLNAEVANVVNDLKGSFLRFPGGNNLEGNSVDQRWIWNETIGPVVDRPGHQGTWSYPNTDALGLIEYLLWCQDMNLTPLLAIWDGLTIGGGTVSGDALEPFVQDALNELEYLTGDASSTWGTLRASHGYPDPFDISYVEIGNEDFLNNGLATYQERFNMFYDAIHEAYPNITVIASTSALAESGCESNCGIDLPAGVYEDVHQYLPPDEFVSKFNFYDNVDRDQPLLVGEYGSTTNNDGTTAYFSSMQNSVSEAVYMIGMERNSDVVKMTCFAPILEHFDLAQWSPDLIGYDAATGITRSTSYFVQQLFSANRGDTVLPVESDTGFDPAFWVASSAGDKTFVKLANYGTDEQIVSINIEGKTIGKVTQLSGDATSANFVGKENVVPVTSDVALKNGSFEFTLPGWSVSVLVAQ